MRCWWKFSHMWSAWERLPHKTAMMRRCIKCGKTDEMECLHDWGQWKTWGITHQSRNCIHCNREEVD